jgi:DNA-binding transcriptional LysR family regulator
VAIRTKNLNLIPILQALLREVSVARAAAEVGLSQPAMSGALARLRVLLNDPLLVRVGRTMRLTPRAFRMRKQLDEVCAQLELFFQPERFDPSTAQDKFVIAAPDYNALILSGALVTRLRTEAPGIRLRFVDVPYDLPNWLDDSTIDLAVCGDFKLWPELRHEHLFWNRIVAAVAKDHPLLKRSRVTVNDLREFPSLDYDTSFSASARGMKVITGIPSLDWTSQISTSQFTDGVLLAVKSQIVARAPATLVERLSELLPLVAIEPSGEETGVDETMFWAPIHDEAQEHIWLRMLVKECLAPLTQGNAPKSKRRSRVKPEPRRPSNGAQVKSKNEP